MCFFKHSWQNEWEHGRHFGDLKSSKQMEHFVKSLQLTLSLFTSEDAMVSESGLFSLEKLKFSLRFCRIWKNEQMSEF